MGLSREGRCWYCGQESLSEDDPPEHVIPAALGGTLKTRRVCRACNERAGREIDAAFQNDWLVAQTRLIHGVRSARAGASGKPRTGLVRAHAKGEPDTIVDVDRDWKPKVRAGIHQDGDRITISANSQEEADKLRRRLEARLAAEGRAMAAFDVEPPRDISAIEVSTRIDGVVWLRMAAKIALGALSLCLDDDWLSTEDAARHQSWMWDPVPVNDAGRPALAFPGEAAKGESALIKPPTHLIAISPIGRGILGVSMGIFGCLYVRTRVAADAALPPPCWVITPGTGPQLRPWPQLLQDMTMAYLKQQEEADRHSPGPATV